MIFCYSKKGKDYYMESKNIKLIIKIEKLRGEYKKEDLREEK